MKRINLNSIGKFVENAYGAVYYGLLLTATYKTLGKMVKGYIDESNVGYDDAVKAIMSSSMFSHDKSEAVSALSPYKNESFYKAIVHIAKDSSMFSHDKVKMIKNLCE